jgi:hypothetical protein
VDSCLKFCVSVLMLPTTTRVFPISFQTEFKFGFISGGKLCLGRDSHAALGGNATPPRSGSVLGWSDLSSFLSHLSTLFPPSLHSSLGMPARICQHEVCESPAVRLQGSCQIYQQCLCAMHLQPPGHSCPQYNVRSFV